jgi:hypothetical protein
VAKRPGESPHRIRRSELHLIHLEGHLIPGLEGRLAGIGWSDTALVSPPARGVTPLLADLLAATERHAGQMDGFTHCRPAV